MKGRYFLSYCFYECRSTQKWVTILFKHPLFLKNKNNMLLLRLFIILSFSLTSVLINGQIPKHLFNEVSEETYKSKDFKSKIKPIKERIGVYSFGMSEGEWELVILENSDNLILQIWDGPWANNLYTKDQCFQRQCRTFNKVTVQGNKILFGNYSGLFADFTDKEKTIHSLLLFCDPIQGRNYGKDSAEVGQFLSSSTSYYNDKERYQLSLYIQPDNYFNRKTKTELKILRNTIYANYGLIFQAGGEMEKYFKNKNWYNPFQKDVSNCLTEIEKINIQTIARLE